MKNLSLNFIDAPLDVSHVSYKDVVIIGNGPSALSLSYFLDGNLPYWKPEEIESHPDELLKARLSYLDANKSLLEHDLYSLTNGLEGRSTNPVSLLFDSLNHPGADLGIKLPCMLKYKYHKDKQVDHIVLGKGKPGGSWQKMDGNLRTLSLSEWMSLPGLSFTEWEKNHKSYQSDEESQTTSEEISNEIKTRALISDVASYYENYVQLMNLSKYFRNDTTVVKIRHVKENEKFNNSKFENARWIVQGFDKTIKKPFLIGCNKVVLAIGSSDLTNRLGVRGEHKSHSWLKYELPLLENAIENLKPEDKGNMKPVLIVGAGLSAADAVIACRNKGLEVIHVFRSVTGGFLGLPQTYFPEYNMVFSMMRNAKTKHENYQALPETTLKEIKSINGKHFVTVQSLRNEECQTFEVSYLAILIGTRPDLSLLTSLNSPSTTAKQHIVSISDNLSENFAVRTLRKLKIFCEKCRHMSLCFGIKNRNIINSLIDDATGKSNPCQCESSVDEKKVKADYGIGFGEDPSKKVDVKNNPLAVNKFTNELLNVPQGVYALGPLVGDNFVRFIPGGAVSIASAIFNGT